MAVIFIYGIAVVALMEKSPEQQLVREFVFFVWRKMPGRTEASKNSSTDRRYKKLPSPKHKKTMSSAGRGDARPSNKAGGGGRGGGGGGSHSSKKESILELAKVSSVPFVVYPSIGVVCSARPPDCAHVKHRIDDAIAGTHIPLVLPLSYAIRGIHSCVNFS
jgi:hypothetical protein